MGGSTCQRTFALAATHPCVTPQNTKLVLLAKISRLATPCKLTCQWNVIVKVVTVVALLLLAKSSQRGIDHLRARPASQICISRASLRHTYAAASVA